MTFASFLRARRARRNFDCGLRISALEKSVGISLSHPDLDLPTVYVIRNPLDSLGWRPWVAVGFPSDRETMASHSSDFLGCSTYGSSRGACERAARDRLWQMALAAQETPVEVGLS